MIKGEGDRMVDWIWRLYNMIFKSGVVPEAWIFYLIAPLCKGKGERTECKKRVSLNVVVKIYAGILVDRVRRVTGWEFD